MKIRKMVSVIIAAFVLSSANPVYAAVNMISVKDSLGTTYSQQVESRLNAAPAIIQDNWNLYCQYIHIADTTYSSHVSYFSYTDGIFIDLIDDATRKQTNSSKKKYANLFHEIGHNIDYTMSDLFTDEKGDCISNTYVSSKYGYTLTDMLHREGKSYFKKIRKKTKSDKKAWSVIDSKLKSYSDTSSYELSDIWDGVSNGKAKAYCGHTIATNGKDYWKTHSVGCEAFANMYEATITNPNGVKLIKKYFPKSYEIFLEELNLKEKSYDEN